MEVNVGIAGGSATVAVTVGSNVGATTGVNGNGAIKVVGRNAPAVRFMITETVGIGGGARVGTSDVTVNPAVVTWGTVTVRGVKLDGGNIAAALRGNAEMGGSIGKGMRAGTPNRLKIGGRKGFCARD
jgi:hypothetical protein